MIREGEKNLVEMMRLINHKKRNLETRMTASKASLTFLLVFLSFFIYQRRRIAFYQRKDDVLTVLSKCD